MKLPSYSEIIGKTKEVIEASLAPVRTLQAKKAAELKHAEIEEKIAMAEVKVHELCGKHPVDYEQVLKAMDDVAWLERRLKQLDKIIDEMFSDGPEKA